jgi:hypothetical protein
MVATWNNDAPHEALMQAVMEWALAIAEVQAVRPRVLVQWVASSANPLADAASRGDRRLILVYCAAMRLPARECRVEGYEAVFAWLLRHTFKDNDAVAMCGGLPRMSAEGRYVSATAGCLPPAQEPERAVGRSDAGEGRWGRVYPPPPPDEVGGVGADARAVEAQARKRKRKKGKRINFVKIRILDIVMTD